MSAIDWLNGLYDLLKLSGSFNDNIRKRNIFPNQEGKFYPLTKLYQDDGIDKELKDIAELLEAPIRPVLRDTQLLSVSDEVGLGLRNNDSIAKWLISKLSESIKVKPNEILKEVSIRLFAWIVQSESYIYLENFPMFAADGRSIIRLSNTTTDNTPLLPVIAWREEDKEFSDIFPSNHIINDAYSEVPPNENVWVKLAEEKFIRRSFIERRDEDEADLIELSPNIYENEEDNMVHNAEEPITVQVLVQQKDIMDEVRNSRDRGYLFWRFLTQRLVKKDESRLKKDPVDCSCGERHEYYTEAWVKSVRRLSWIRDGDNRSAPNAKSLGKLLREKGWEHGELNEDENSTTIKLLEALNISPVDLKLGIIAEDEEKRDELVDLAVRLYEDDVSTKQMLEIIQDLKKDEKLPQILKERRNNLHTWNQNQRLGSEVEELVRKILEKEGFLVTSRPKGADFKIQQKIAIETGTLTTLDIKKDHQSWLIEVKSTRTENEHTCVRLSTTQAKEAERESERFLLCVVPIGQEITNLNNVRQKMLFIEGIGEHLKPHCENLDDLETFREDITTEDKEFELVIDRGNAGILVKKNVWEKRGFPIEELIERLK